MSASEPTPENRLWPRSVRDVAITFALAAVYFAAGKLGLKLAVVHPSATAVWAPTGIALAAFLLKGPRVWPGVYVGAFLVNATTAGTLLTSLGIATGNTLEGLVAAALIRRFAKGPRAFETAIDVFRYLILGGLFATSLSPTMGLTSLAAGGFAPWSNYGTIWVTWWLGDVSGALVVAPALILWGLDHRLSGGRRKAIEAAALTICLLLVSLLLFGSRSPFAARHDPLQFLSFPILIWAAFRFGSRETASATLLLSGIATWGTVQGFGPFAPMRPTTSLVVLQTFMAVTSVTMLVVAALVAERRRAAQARDDFLSIAGHELRTPLSTLTLQVENLHRGLVHGNPPEALAARADSIRRSSRRLAALVDELLNVSRVTSGVVAVTLEPVELSVFAREAANHFLDQLATAEIRAVLKADEPVWCRTDRERLGYVFNNLVANAIKYGGGRPIEITVSRRDHVARLSVRDHGPGISKEDQRRIFERFERAVSASHVSGFGLGLWIARQTVEALGGRIQVESEPGEGSTFTVDLPLDETAGVSSPEGGPAPKAGGSRDKAPGAP